MMRSRSIFVVLAVLIMGVSFAVPAEDMLETAWDESESLPCENAPVFSVSVPEAIACAPFRMCASLLCLGPGTRPLSPRPENETGRSSLNDSRFLLDYLLRC